MVNHEAGPLDRIFHAISDPTRRAVLEELTKGVKPVGELARPFDMSFPAVTKHIQVLEQAGLVRKSRRGKFVECHLEEPALAAASTWIEEQRSYWKQQLDGLERFLDAEAVLEGESQQEEKGTDGRE